MIRATEEISQPSKVLQQVQQVRQTKRWRDRSNAWLIGAAVLTGGMLLAMIVESRLNLFSHAFRIILTVDVLAATAVCVWYLLKRSRVSNERLVSAAQDVDAAYPGLEQRVTTLTSCEEDFGRSRKLVHPAMLRKVSAETADLHQSIEPKPIVSHRMLRWPLSGLALAAISLVAMLSADASKTMVQLGRFWAPWSDLSVTQVESAEADHVAARNEPVKLTASLSGRPVEQVKFFSRSLDGSSSLTKRLWPSTKDRMVANYRQPKALESFEYRFRAGDGQTAWHRVTVADRPKIENLKMRIVPPEYTGRAAREYSRLPKKLRVVAGSRLEMSVTPRQDVRTARLVMGKTDWISMEPTANEAYRCEFELRQPIGMEVQLTELHGLMNRRPPRTFLQVVADQAPKVKILKPTPAAIVLPDETLDIHYQATDDFGIREMSLRVYTQRAGEDTPKVHEVKIPIDADKNQRKLKGSVQLDLAAFDIQHGDSIRYEIRASDNYLPLEDLTLDAALQPMQGAMFTDGKAASEPSKPKVLNPAAESPVAENEIVNREAASDRPPSDGSPMPLDPAKSIAQNESPDRRASQASNSSNHPAAGSPAVKGQAKNEVNPKAGSTEVGSKVATSKPAAANAEKPTHEPKKELAEAPIAQSEVGKPNSADAPAEPKSQSKAEQPGGQAVASNNDPGSSKPRNAKSKDDSPTNPPSEPNASQSEPVKMATRSLDIGQSSSSGQRKIKVDRYAGGFESEQRRKLEIAISPTLELLKASLERAGGLAREVMQLTASDPKLNQDATDVLTAAADELKIASEAVIALNKETTGTPYAFVGLRLESIRTADVAPGWADLRAAIKHQGEARLTDTRSGWNHIHRAIEALAKLDETYQQVKRDFKRADDMLRFKKMHRVFIENSLAMLNPDNFSLNGPSRKGAEFDLDEEYLKRLKEVMEMRRDMMAELARILADDPQLLRRYMNQQNERTWSIRDQLTLLAHEQAQLSERVHAWADTLPDPAARGEHQVAATELHLVGFVDLATKFADLQDRFESWLPLEEHGLQGEAIKTRELFRQTSSQLTDIVADIGAIGAADGLKSAMAPQLDPLLRKMAEVERSVPAVDRSLRRVKSESENYELTNNATRRLLELRPLGLQLRQWLGKLESISSGSVHEAYAVDQTNHRAELMVYLVKIASLESQLAAALQSRDGRLPAEISNQTQELLKTLDITIPELQLIASQTLLDAEATAAVDQQSQLAGHFEQAEKLFSEIIQAVADELDKLPPEDPIASLLRDPTLDEILSQLENEQDFLEELGLSARPTNLQIIGDWNRGGRGGGGGMSGAMQQLMSQRQNMRRLANRAFRNAMARTKKDSPKKKPRLANEDRRWNILVGRLGEDMLQGDNKVPPERYRAPINQYFEAISKLKSGRTAE